MFVCFLLSFIFSRAKLLCIFNYLNTFSVFLYILQLCLDLQQCVVSHFKVFCRNLFLVIERTYPNAFFLTILLPVSSTVTEHQKVACYPIWAPVTTLSSNSSNLSSFTKINLKPLIFIGHKWRPATSTLKRMTKSEKYS